MEKTIKKPVEEKPTVGKADRRINAILSVVLGVLCVAWIYPIVMIFFNSLKTERAITTSRAFELPTAGTFVGLKNYIYGIQEMDFLSSFWYSLVITVSSVVLILLCCSMCAWFITRVNGKLSKLMYGLCMFSMVVPFQMVMFTLAKTADSLKLNNPYNICIIYLGFGAGLAVFMFTGFMKSMPVEIEEAAMIDGCNPLQIFFRVVCPILKPTMISTAILETMWVWNDYLLPTLVLDIKTYVSSITQEVRNPQLQSFVINGWGADYGDPVNFVGQEILHDDNAYYSWYYSNIAKIVEAGPADWQKDLVACYEEFTDLVNTAKAIVDDTDARYAAFAKAEASMLNNVLACPCYFDVSWTLTHANEYSKINAMYGPCNYKAVNWETSEEAYTTEQYEEFAAAFDAATKA